MKRKLVTGAAIVILVLILGVIALYFFPKQICDIRGGEYFRAGASGTFGCYIKATDGGKECSDSKQCQGRCEAFNLDINELSQEVTFPASKVDGVCSEYTNLPFGCYSELKNGMIDRLSCVD